MSKTKNQATSSGGLKLWLIISGAALLSLSIFVGLAVARKPAALQKLISSAPVDNDIRQSISPDGKWVALYDEVSSSNITDLSKFGRVMIKPAAELNSDEDAHSVFIANVSFPKIQWKTNREIAVFFKRRVPKDRLDIKLNEKQYNGISISYQEILDK